MHTAPSEPWGSDLELWPRAGEPIGPHTTGALMVDGLYKRLRSREVLHRSWAAVKQNGLSSPSDATVRAINRYDENWLNNLEQISKRLRAGTFRFDGE